MPSSDNDNSTINFNSLFCEADTLIPELPFAFKNDTTRCCKDVYNEGVLSCKHPYRDEYQDEGKGFKLGDKIIWGVSSALPIYIPIPTQDFKHKPLTLNSSYLGITLEDLYPRARHKIHGVWDYKSGTSPDVVFATSRVYGSSEKILFYSGPDLLIEGFNRDKYCSDTYNQLKSAGINISTTPDFSVNPNSCSYGQVVNTNRTLAVGEEMSVRGIAVIPNVFATHPYLLDMWVVYLNSNRDQISFISINCQRQRSRKDLQNLWWYIKELATRTNVHIVLHGYNLSKLNLEAIKPVACQIHFADTAPFCMAIRGRMYQTYDATRHELVNERLVTNDVRMQAAMVQTSIQAREQYLRAEFYSHMSCNVNTFTNLSVPT
ncbi:MAG TPA: DUF4417 domain-containing protein [Candidatus Paceibacterota bacterium]|nr:DUF4417 domain-containing protein [Candidatus Paceibacterota bacterium]HMO83203.1 DUF4417 domain-containing protein [Candidatus Paceibacterota bacterium]